MVRVAPATVLKDSSEDAGQIEISLDINVLRFLHAM